MVKKSFLLVILFAFIFLASGCVTICAEKVYVDGKSPQCIKKSTPGETKGSPGGMVQKTDDWVKENLW